MAGKTQKNIDLKDEKTFPAGEFLESIGVNSAVSLRGETLESGNFHLVVRGENYVSGDKEITIVFDKKHLSLKKYDPTIEKEPLKELRDTDNIQLTVSTYPFIIEIENQKK